MIRKLARPMLASVYIVDGVQTLRDPNVNKESTKALLEKVRGAIPREYRGLVPNDPKTAAQVVGGIKAGAGSLFAIGKLPRTSAALLAATAIPSIIGRNAFWEADESSEKKRRQTGALTDIALAGGVLLATVDTAGKPGLQWRAQQAARTAKKNVQQALPTQSETEKALGKASNWISDTADQVVDYVDHNKDDWKKQASKFAGQASDAAEGFWQDASKQTSSFLSDAGDWIEEVSDNAESTYKDLKPSKLQQFKAKRKVNSVVGDLQDKLESLEPSKLDQFKAKRKVKKNVAKLQDRAQGAVDSLQDAFDNLDVAPSKCQQRKWKRKAKKAEKRATKLVKKAQKKLS